MKKKLLIFFGFIILIIGVLLVVPGMVDGNRFKPLVIDGFEAATGREIIINGDLSLKLIPSPALSVSDVSLANIPGGQAENFLKLESLDLRLEFFPLLSGDYQITSLVLDGGVINLERDAAGVANWEALFIQEETAPEEDSSAVALDSFILNNTTVSYTDVLSSQAETITGLDADLVVASLAGPFEGEGEFTYQGVALEFELSTGEFSEGATVLLNMALAPEGDGPGLGFRGTYVEEGGIRAISGAMTLGGDNAETIISVLAKAGGMEAVPTGDWQNAYSGDATLLAVLTKSKTEISLEPMTLTLGDSTLTGDIGIMQQDALSLDANVSIDTIALDPWMRDDTAEEVPFELSEDISATLNVEIGTATYKSGEIDDATIEVGLERGVLTIEQIQAAIPGNTSITLYGTLEARSGRPVFSGNVDLESRTFKTLLNWLDVDYSEFPNNRLNRLTFSGKVRHADPIFEIENATATLDSTRFTGGMSLNLDTMSQFALTGSVNTLDLDSYFPALMEKSEAATMAERVRNMQEALQGFSDYTGLINLKAARLKVMAASLQGVEFIGNLMNDRLAIQTLDVRSFEGARVSFSGGVENISDDFDFTLDASLSSGNFAPLMAWGEMDSPFEERVVPSGEIELKVTGDLDRAALDASGVFSGIAFNLDGEAADLAQTGVYQADLTLRHPNTVELIRKFSPDYFPANSALGQFTLEGSVSGSESRTSIENLVFDLGPSSFRGDLVFAENGGRSRITGSLTARSIPMDDFMAATNAGLNEAVNEGGARWSRDQWDVDFLRNNDFDVSLSADSLAFRTYRFLNPAVRLVGAGGILTVDGLEAGVFDGTVMLNATMDGRDVPILEGRYAFENISAEDALGASADITNFTGTVTLDGSFRGEGNSQEEMIRTLSGSATVSSENGVIKGVNMPRLSEQMATLDSLAAFTRVIGAALEGGETPYRFISTEATILDGVIAFDAIESDVDDTDIAARGTVNLPRWRMDVTGAMGLKDHPDVPAIGVSMKGRADEPEVKYDYIALTAFMTQRFTSSLFQQLLDTPTEEDVPPAEGESEGGEAPVGETDEPSLEEEVIKGLFDLLGGDEEEEAETPPEEEDEGEGG